VSGCGPAVVAVVLALLVAGSGAAAAIEAAAVLILYAVSAAAVLAVAALAAAVVLLRRWNRREAEKFTLRAEALREPRAVPQVAAPAPQMIVNHFYGGTHIHAAVPLGVAEDGRTIQAIPVQRDAITTTTTEE
jgi:hypothetical protein